MSKAVSLSAKIDPNLKQRTENIFEQLGLTPSQAITLFYKQVTLRQGIPFHLEVPADSKQILEKTGWTGLALEGLEYAYGESEPEYPLHLIREHNPDYQA